jgi:hypothetical protein
MAHKGSQAAAISRKSVFGNAAILAACNGRNYLAIFKREFDQKSQKLLHDRFSPLLGGDLNPILGFCFPLFSMLFPGEFPSR